MGEHAGYHRHLNVAGNAQLTLHALLDGGGGLQLTVGFLQRVVRLAQFQVGTVAEDGINGKGNDEYDDDEDSIKLSLAGRTGFRLQYLHISGVDGLQFAGIEVAVVDNGGVEHLADLPCRQVDKVLLVKHLVGMVLLQQIALYVVQGIDAELFLKVFQDGAVVGDGLVPASSHGQVVAGIGPALSGVSELRPEVLIVGFFGLVVTPHAL